jgi:hypothetical protein
LTCSPKAVLRQAFGSQHDAGPERQQLALLLLFDHLPIDQLRMGCTDGFAWAAWLASAHQRRPDVEGGDERRQRARTAAAEKRWDPRDTRLGGRNDLLGRCTGTCSHNGRNQQPKLGDQADPDPLPPILAVGQACARLVRLMTHIPHPFRTC